jgi:hypothetical protein
MYTIFNLVSIEKCKLMSSKRLDFDTIYNQYAPLSYLEDTMLGLPSPDPLSDDSNQEALSNCDSFLTDLPASSTLPLNDDTLDLKAEQNVKQVQFKSDDAGE